MKLKKIIPIFIFIFSIFFIGNNNVKANEKSKIDTKFMPNYVYTSATDGMLDFADNKIGDKYHIPVKNDDFNEEMIIHYEEDGIYWKTATDDKLIYSESNFLKVQWSLVYTPEFDQFIIYMHNMYNWEKNKLFHRISIIDNNYDTFPLYTDSLDFRASYSDFFRYKIMYSKNSKINIQKSYDHYGFTGYKWYFYFSNRPVYIDSGSTDKKYLNFMSSVNKPVVKINFVESKYNDDVFLYNKYRLNIENFNEDYIYYFAKYSEKDTDQTIYNKYSEFYYENGYFRVLYGKEHQQHLSSDKTYFDFILNKNDVIIVEIKDKNNKSIVTYTYNVTTIPENNDILPYITTDDMSSCTVKYKGKEYITCRNYLVNAHFSDLTSYYLYMSTDLGKTFKKVDTNYGKYHFTGTENGQVFIFKVLDKDGNEITSTTYNIVGLSNYEDIKTFTYITTEASLSYDEDGNYHYGSVYYWFHNWNSSYKLYYAENKAPTKDDKYRVYPISHSDSLYGLGYKYTNDLNAVFLVYDENDEEIYTFTYNFFMDELYESNTSSFYKFLDKWWTNISAPFTVFKQFVQLIKAFDYSDTTSITPSFTIDLSYFGVNKTQSIIDFSWYLQYRDIIFNFIYLTLGFVTSIKVIHNLKNVFGGGN